MGAGIAIVSARAGFNTVCYDISADALAAAAKQTGGFFEKSVARGKMSQEQMDAALGSMSQVTSLAQLCDCDLVIEAVYEDLAVKQSLMAELEKHCADHAIFASNTSTLSITEIASGCARSERVRSLASCPLSAWAQTKSRTEWGWRQKAFGGFWGRGREPGDITRRRFLVGPREARTIGLAGPARCHRTHGLGSLVPCRWSSGHTLQDLTR